MAMHTEIERKFIVDTSMWEPKGQGEQYKQGYISVHPERAVRVRIAGQSAFLCIKGKASNFSRREFEYGIPVSDAEQMLKLFCKRPPIEKRRHKEIHHGKLWEIDVFQAENDGLVLAEVELESEGEEIILPDFASREVSSDERYLNSNLYRMPFIRWR